MDDLSGLSWDSSPSNLQAQLPDNGANYASLRPTPPNVSRQATPLSSNHSGRNTPIVPSSGLGRPAGQDSFSNLLPVKKPTQLSLQERQKQLIEERARQQAEQQKRRNEQFKLDDSTFWEGFGSGSGRSTPATNGKPGSIGPDDANGDDLDILAAFNASAPVDSSSHFPPPKRQDDTFNINESRDGSRHRQHDIVSTKRKIEPPAEEIPADVVDDDDPFGLGQMAVPNAAPRSSGRSPLSVPTVTGADDDDDVLGILGKPVAEVSNTRKPMPIPLGEEEVAQSIGADSRNQAIAELVDMGFPVDRSREALDQTETGVDVQAAVGWLLNQAHQASKSRSHATESGEARQSRNSEAIPTGADILSGDRNAWRSQTTRSNRNNNSSPPATEKDVALRATELGNTLFKSANSLWKTGQKRMQKAMAEFQQEGDANQPRWLREPQESHNEAQLGNVVIQRNMPSRQPLVTDEAMLLDTQRPSSRPDASRNKVNSLAAESRPTPQRRPPVAASRPLDLPTRPASRPTDRINKQSIEEQSAQAYVSPARRKRPQPQAPTRPPASEVEQELDIFSSQQAPPPARRPSTQKPPSVSASPRPSVTTRPKAPPRQIPAISPSSLLQSSGHRLEGTAAFKRGDYAAAHASYSSAIAPLPAKHPITIILYSNRALTSLKTGDPKAAILDSDTALGLIGPSKGEGEFISLDEGEADKPMKEYYGKALMRKAEALEHMEKWIDAAKIWREAVEIGVGGSLSIQGRNRCEKAAGIAPASATATSSRPSAAAAPGKQRPVANPMRRSAAADLVGPSDKESEAVARLRAANAAAVAQSDEAFALNDSVDARLKSWKNGKEGNLRALLASLDTVLWNGAGWTNVGMGDLVLPNRCKVVYMKAIAKCHPDKIPPDASTEQRMISASVFATLNEAWDHFKRDNGL